jgi:hypothetical protein
MVLVGPDSTVVLGEGVGEDRAEGFAEAPDEEESFWAQAVAKRNTKKKLSMAKYFRFISFFC